MLDSWKPRSVLKVKRRNLQKKDEQVDTDVVEILFQIWLSRFEIVYLLGIPTVYSSKSLKPYLWENGNTVESGTVFWNTRTSF